MVADASCRRKGGDVRHRICQIMTLMPTGITVGVGGYDTTRHGPNQMDKTHLICALPQSVLTRRDNSHRHRHRQTETDRDCVKTK
ncbi:MAG: hypothetical protein J07HQW2_00445 [Haloquadratum walsbyi J07HQW2]|uniref:Uncharacterized protein n=1 Tax=Haloquadratum walsbyi J07HQW2 TaxID=1238425 RepID=U1PNZ9_9EURY|nr:MAG: hypothetical protein J07HQW2_00445 [Haloquadratum walsbyi J07HQW2]